MAYSMAWNTKPNHNERHGIIRMMHFQFNPFATVFASCFSSYEPTL